MMRYLALFAAWSAFGALAALTPEFEALLQHWCDIAMLTAQGPHSR